MSKKIKHLKKRNSGLLYEFLTRHISNCLVLDKKDESLKTLSLIKKYFSSGTKIHEELMLYKAIVDSKVKTKESAFKMLNEVYSQYATIDIGKLNEEKSKLIKDLNYNFDSKLIYSYKVPEYTIYASLNVLLNDKRSNKKVLNENIDRIKLEDNIVSFLTNKENKQINEVKLDPSYTDVVYKLIVNKFHEKYSKQLNENQRKLISKYVVSQINNNKSILQEEIKKESNIIKDSLRTITDEQVSKDVDLSKKINECYKKFVSTDFENMNEDRMIEFLEYMSLIHEMKQE